MLLLVLSLAFAAEPLATLIPPADRQPLPAFAPLGAPGDGFAQEQLQGKVTVINIWYEY